MTQEHSKELTYSSGVTGELTYYDIPQDFPPDDPQNPPVAQVLFEGNWFARDVARDKLHEGAKTTKLMATRRVRIIAGNGGLGNVFETLDETKVTPGDLPKLPLSEARISRAGGTIYDSTDDEDRSLETVRSHGASTRGTKIQLRPGAIPGYKLIKPAGSFNTNVGAEIEAAIEAKNSLLTTISNN